MAKIGLLLHHRKMCIFFFLCKLFAIYSCKDEFEIQHIRFKHINFQVHKIENGLLVDDAMFVKQRK